MRSSVRQWAGMRSEYAVLPPSDRVTVTGSGQIGVAFSGHRRLVRKVDEHTQRIDTAPGVTYVTGQHPIQWLKVGEPVEALEIYPEPALLERAAGGATEMRPALAVPDGTMFALACTLRAVHLGRATLTDLEASTLTHRLAEHVVDRYGPGARSGPGSRTLSAGQVDTVAAFVDAHLAGPLTLDALAAAVSFSPFHFARSFRATTGLTPHAFATAHRLTRAKDRLLRSDAAVRTVAYEVGFSNVSHFRLS